jgi:hypothetical protein
MVIVQKSEMRPGGKFAVIRAGQREAQGIASRQRRASSPSSLRRMFNSKEKSTMTHRLARLIGFWSQVLIGLLLVGMGTPQLGGAPAAPVASGVRVGTFQRGSLIMAFYRSAFWNAKLSELMAQRNQAATKGDLATIDQIEGRIRALQELGDKQLAGKEPINNIYEQLKPMWAEIAREANVQLIIEDPLFLAPGTPLQDITSYLLKRFPPKPRTPAS